MQQYRISLQFPDEFFDSDGLPVTGMGFTLARISHHRS